MGKEVFISESFTKELCMTNFCAIGNVNKTTNVMKNIV